ncbi:MAG: hypothetical protein ACRD96_25445 [Bryobacteraceae bacterium]
MASVIIIVASVALMYYWFRYVCRLVLANGTERSADLVRLLDNDGRLVWSAVSQIAGVDPFERRLLVLDYVLQRGWYRLTGSPAALDEMRSIVAFFSA